MEDNYYFLGRCFPLNLDNNKERLPFFSIISPKRFPLFVTQKASLLRLLFIVMQVQVSPIVFL